MAASRFRLLAATIAARGSRDRSALDVLLDADELPDGWRRRRDSRYRMGFGGNEEWDERSRQAKLVGAGRLFVNPQTRGRLVIQAFPTATEEDARAALTKIWDRRLISIDLNAQAAEEVEVTPPTAAGEHARALLIGTTGRAGDVRKLFVAWAEPATMYFGMALSSPADQDL